MEYEEFCFHIQQYENKLEEVNKENDQLRSSHQQAMEMVREIELKLSFSQGTFVKVLREIIEC